jgi:hypothetical protein
MNVSTFTMNKAEAEKKLVAYKQQLKRRTSEEYDIAAKAYALVAKGHAILNLVEVFTQTGLGEDLRPRLAIARADRKEVEVTVRSDSRNLTFSTLNGSRSEWNYQGDLLVRVPYEYTDEQRSSRLWKSGFSLVPMIPADVREDVAGQDKDYFILWEVEHWSDRSLTSRPSRDPYLMKHIAGDLYAVMAEWDLTELEASIMAGVRNRRR